MSRNRHHKQVADTSCGRCALSVHLKNNAGFPFAQPTEQLCRVLVTHCSRDAPSDPSSWTLSVPSFYKTREPWLEKGRVLVRNAGGTRNDSQLPALHLCTPAGGAFFKNCFTARLK